MGRVFLAEHVFMNRKVAIKVLHPELTAIPEYVQRFEREAKAAARIVHPHVAQALDFGRLEDQSLYLVLEHVEGSALSDVVRQGPTEPLRSLTIALQVASAMAQAHEKQIIHRDLKPDNILLLLNSEEGDFVKILDFGIAKVEFNTDGRERALTQVGMVYGTPGYMAPEQGLGQEVDARADVYALGVILYELLAGRVLFEGAATAILGQQLTRKVPFLSQKNADSNVPAQIERLVREMLAVDREQRPKSMSVVVTRIEELLREGVLNSTNVERLGPRGASKETSSSSWSGLRGGSRTTRSKTIWPVSVKTAGTVVGFVLFGAALSVAVTLALESRRGPQEKEVVASAEKTPEPGPPRTFLDELARAKPLGVSALSELGRKYPAEPLVHVELSLKHAVEGHFLEAVDEAQLALALDPALCRSPSLRGALFRSAQSEEARDVAFRLLLGPMGQEGTEVLFDLWQGAEVGGATRERARRLLTSDQGKSSASEAVRLAVELEMARSCKVLLPLLERASLAGDRRSLPRLEELAKNERCVRGGQVCYPCLRKSSKLEEARLAIEQRELLRKSDAQSWPDL